MNLTLEEYRKYLGDDTLTEEKIIEKYRQDKEKYDNEVNKIVGGYKELDMNEFIDRIGGQEKIDAIGSEEQKIEKQNLANQKAKEKYDEVSTSFLWIKNIWLADSTVSPVMKYSDFIKKSKVTSEQVSEAEYNLIISPMSGVETKNNGYFILAILAAGLNYLSYGLNNWISSARAKKKGLDPKLTNNSSNKILTIIMPIIMGIFTLFYNAAFGLYIVAGALITLITSPLVTLFVDMLEFDAISKEKQKTVAIYDRKRK